MVSVYLQLKILAQQIIVERVHIKDNLLVVVLTINTGRKYRRAPDFESNCVSEEKAEFGLVAEEGFEPPTFGL